LMSALAKSSIAFQRLSPESTANSTQDSLFGDDLEGNPFDGKKSWDEFKKEYYQIEKKIKKALESLHLILIEFTKQISLADSRTAKEDNTVKLCQDFQNTSKQARTDLDQLSNLFKCLKRNKGDTDELIKQNMFKRFKEIHQEHEREYTRLNNSFDLNKKKLELFNETLKLGELNVDKKIGSSTALLIQQNQDLSEAVSMSNRILDQAGLVTRAFGSQSFKLNRVSLNMKKMIEEFGGVSDVLKKIKYFKLKRIMVFTCLAFMFALYVIYRICKRWL